MNSNNVDLKPGEQIDHLRVQQMKIIQKEDQFKFSVDAVLLAHFAFLRQKAEVIDLGTGTGIISLLMAWRGAKHVDSIEINPVMADAAARSVALNNLGETISVHNMDMRQIKEKFLTGCCDLVVSNPPYRPVTQGDISKLDALAMARHEVTATLHDVIMAARYLVKFRGRFAMVHLPERLSEIMVEMHNAGIEPKRMRMVHGDKTKRPGMVLIEGIVGSKPGIIVEPPLFIYGDDGNYTEEILKYYY